MQDLRKVNSNEIIGIWKGVSTSLFVVLLVVIFCKILPFYLAPVVGLLGACFLYSLLYGNKLRGGSQCQIIPYAVFFCLVVYSFLAILANVLYIWGLWELPDEFVFFNDPYIPTLWLNPVSFFTLLVIYLRRKRLRLCIDCKITHGAHTERGIFGTILNRETRIQLRNLLFLTGILSLIVWTYYIVKYDDVYNNGKDRYIFFWITVIGILLDEVYFLYRYYNLYLDLKDNNELISPEELQDMTAKTYLRYYVICGNKVYLRRDMEDYRDPQHKSLDTPFFTKRTVNGITQPEVKDIIKKMTGGIDGELKFFYGRKSADIDKHSLLRYFYFLDGKPEDYEIEGPGEWMDFNEVKAIYSHRPSDMSIMGHNDLTRLATIIVTEKLFNEDGTRKMKIKSYMPSFDLEEVRKSNLDFQDDKWIRISVFNADSKFFRIRQKLRKMFSGNKRPSMRG